MRSYWPKGDRNEAPLSQAPPPPDSCLAGLPIITAVVLNSVPLQGMGVQASVPPLKALVPALGDGGWVKPVKLSGPGEDGSGVVPHGCHLQGGGHSEKSAETQAVAQLRET